MLSVLCSLVNVESSASACSVDVVLDSVGLTFESHPKKITPHSMLKTMIDFLIVVCFGSASLI